MRRFAWLGSGWICAVLPSAPVGACAICFGDPNSSMAQGARAGILVLIGVVGFVLSWITGIAVFWMFRARALRRQGAWQKYLEPLAH